MVDDLLAGHVRFLTDYRARERAFLAELAARDQQPRALFIGCSDSRVIPELLTDAGPGQLFVVRNIANRVPAPTEGDRSVGAAIEYAVGQLGVGDIIVCGHTGCGGIKAALDGPAGLEPGSALGTWLAGLGPVVERARMASPDPVVQHARAVEENVLAGLATLGETWIPTLAGARTVRLHAWIYDLAEAALRLYDDESGRFVALAELSPAEAP
jgi:carbonic anhydrase